MKHPFKNQRGETIVEVVVAFVIFLLFTAMFDVSVRFASRMQVEAQRIANEATWLEVELYKPNTDPAAEFGTPGAPQDLNFTRSEGGAFTVNGVKVNKKTVEATPTDENGDPQVDEAGNPIKYTYTFQRYQ